MKKHEGIIVDVVSRKKFKGEVQVEGGKIVAVIEKEHNNNRYILPGLVDAHVHIESSMITPSSFSRMVVPRGTVAVVTDPHEIANVMGVDGVDYMIADAQKVPLKTCFGVPSCVPATPFESSGAVIDAGMVDQLLARDDLHYLSEMMNFPGVVNGFPDVVKKTEAARKHEKVIDGHAPGLNGEDLKKYIAAGISTDHECFSYEEAVAKIELGMKVLIREGSAAKNFETLYKLIDEYPDSVMLCTDDSHPDTLINEGHIDKMIRYGLEKNLDLFNLLQAAIVNPVKHYGLNVGLLQVGDPADFIVVDYLNLFNVVATYIDGECVFDHGRVLFQTEDSEPVNVFHREKITEEAVRLTPREGRIRVIVAEDGELLTGQELVAPRIENNNVVSDSGNDVLKMVVLSRYDNTPAQIGFIKNIGLKAGAIASSIAHDSHNIIAVGMSDENITTAINKLIENKGGIVVVTPEAVFDLPLEVAGLMSTRSGEEVAEKYQQLNREAQQLGTTLKSPFMTLSFMSLLVIPKLKLGDKGLFDVTKFDFVDLFVVE